MKNNSRDVKGYRTCLQEVGKPEQRSAQFLLGIRLLKGLQDAAFGLLITVRLITIFVQHIFDVLGLYL